MRPLQTALLCALLACAASLLAQPNLTRNGSISGRLIDGMSREPIAGQTLVLFSPAGSFPTVETGANGEFVFPNLPEGSYGVAPPPGSAVSSFGRKVQIRPGAEKVENILIVANRTATVSGSVLAADGRTPAPSDVLLVRTSQRHGEVLFSTRRKVTDAAGNFIFDNVEPGNVHLAALPTPPVITTSTEPPPSPLAELPIRTGPVRTFYPNAQSIDTAIPIEVGKASAQSGIVIQLVEDRLLTARTHIAEEGLPAGTGFSLRLQHEFEPGLSLAEGEANPGDWIDIGNLSPGLYRLAASGLTAESASIVGSLGFALSPAHAELPPLAASPLRSLSGSIRVLDANLPPPLLATTRVTLVPRNRSRYLTEDLVAKIDTDGRLRIPAVAPEEYRVEVRPPKGYYVGELWQGSLSLGTKPVFGAGEQLEIVLRDDGAAILGIVRDKHGAIPPDAGVWLIHTSDKDTALLEEPSVTSTDQDGRFAFESLRPGTYRLVAMRTSDVRYAAEVTEPLFLKSLAAKATELRLAERQRQPQTLEAIER